MGYRRNYGGLHTRAGYPILHCGSREVKEETMEDKRRLEALVEKQQKRIVLLESRIKELQCVP